MTEITLSESETLRLKFGEPGQILRPCTPRWNGLIKSKKKSKHWSRYRDVELFYNKDGTKKFFGESAIREFKKFNKSELDKISLKDGTTFRMWLNVAQNLGFINIQQFVSFVDSLYPQNRTMVIIKLYNIIP